MAEGKSSFAGGIKDEALDQGAHFVASGAGKAVRGLIQSTFQGDFARKLFASGVPQFSAQILAVVIRSLMPDSKLWDTAKDVVTEFLSESLDNEKTGGANGGSSAAANPVVSRTGSGSGGYIPLGLTTQVLSLNLELVQKIIGFMKHVYGDPAKGGEAEVERIYTWLNTLTEKELEVFALMRRDLQWVTWKAQADPKEQKRLLDEARATSKKILDALVAKYRELDAKCVVELPKQEARIAELIAKRDAPLSRRERLSLFAPWNW